MEMCRISIFQSQNSGRSVYRTIAVFECKILHFLSVELPFLSKVFHFFSAEFALSVRRILSGQFFERKICIF